jgi:hypothetical protein
LKEFIRLICTAARMRLRRIVAANALAALVIMPLPAQLRATSNVAPAQLGSQLVVITARGFDTPEITRKQGPFIMLIQNRSMLHTLDLSLNLVTNGIAATLTGKSALLASAHTPDQHDRSYQLDLTPGIYVFSVDQKPQWKVTLTITP